MYKCFCIHLMFGALSVHNKRIIKKTANMVDINNETLAIILCRISSACGLEAAALLLEENSESRPRSCWVKPWRKSRDSSGNIQFLLKEYNLYDDAKPYTSFIRMDQECFSKILNFVKKDIERSDTSMRKCIRVEEKLAVILRFLATGDTLKEVSENSKLSAPYLSSAVMEVCSAIYRNTKCEFLQV